MPIYAAASWASLTSTAVAFYVDPVRDIYEAFTIYTFFQLLINFIGGERSLIIMMHGRAPVSHPWPLNHCFRKVDISDPYTFLAIKRGILQYAWLKPVLSLATIVTKSTGTYEEGYLSVTSGYLWIGIVYNLSVSLSLYALAMFWVCMHDDLKPFRPVPKFLCVKLIIFASYWQGFFLSILQALGAIPSVRGYTQDNLAAAIQDALICCELPLFAVAHWYAFSWHDYADVTISSARMPVKYALRDAFGPVDLIQDTRETFAGGKYEYRAFDARDDVLTHEESESRVARMRQGMRYSRGGGKYWIPRPGDADSRRPLLGEAAAPDGPPTLRSDATRDHGTFSRGGGDSDLDPAALDEQDERLFARARALAFGDFNYPVVTAHMPLGERWQRSDPALLTTATNRNLLHPSKANRRRREQKIEERFQDTGKGRSRSRPAEHDPRAEGDDGGDSDGEASLPNPNMRAPVVADLARQRSATSSRSARSGRSQLVDLVVEDDEAEEAERVRARKEGGAMWNEGMPQHFV